jgi:Fic family protein
LFAEIPADISMMIKSISEIRSLEGLRRSSYRKELETVEKIAIAMSVKYSNEIEGIVTSDERIMDLVLRWDEPLTHDEGEIAGYRDALSDIHANFSTMDFDEDNLTSLHRAITSRNLHKGGRYKNKDNAIISVDKRGERRIVFRPVPASETKHAMEQMMLAYMEARDEGMEPLLLIPCAILDFLCIHPFSDGNGRVSRLATALLLYMNGIDACRYVSMDERISRTKGGYYAALAESSKGWNESENTYAPFVRYFLRVLLECYMDLDTRFSIVCDRKMKKSERIEAMVMNSPAPISKRQILYALPDVSSRTADAAMADMMKSGKIVKVGTFRDARYVAKRR